jgi:hypothetical protein
MDKRVIAFKCGMCGGVVTTADEPGDHCRCGGVQRDYLVTHYDQYVGRAEQGNRNVWFESGKA